MNSGISRALKKEFHKKMVADLPEFQRAGTATGGTVYRKYDVTTGLYIFVFVQPHSKEDRFTLELGSSLTKDFPFAILPGDHAPNGEARYRINRFLKQKTDGWWNVNMPESRLPDWDAIMKTFEPEAIQKGLARLPKLVDDAVEQVKFALPRFLATIQVTSGKT
ncbi:MAG TPA: hypothetical protein VKT33_05825 [Candidatus Angelobacter sp.]|nr:hypothetical protein [Candidatus Angelobacter sp.]